jgi:hypothetical protein
MPRCLLLLVLGPGCPLLPGTQIGVEHDGPPCLIVSLSVLDDPAAVPDGFAVSPLEALGLHIGQFDGVRYDEQEQATDQPIRLTVTATESRFSLARYEHPDPRASDEICPDAAFVEVDVVFEAGADVRFEQRVVLRIDELGSGQVDWTGPPEAFAALPPPSFDPEAADGVKATFSGGHGMEGPWWASVGWSRELVTDEGLEPDARETVLWGWAGEGALDQGY